MLATISTSAGSISIFDFCLGVLTVPCVAGRIRNISWDICRKALDDLAQLIDLSNKLDRKSAV